MKTTWISSYLEKTAGRVVQPFGSSSITNMAGNQNTHVRHKFGGHPGSGKPMYSSVSFRNIFGSRILSAKAWEPRKIQNVGGRRHRTEGYGGPNFRK